MSEETPSPKVEQISADDLVGDLPPVSPEAESAASGAAETPAPAPTPPPPIFGAAAELDDKGTPYDPVRHVHTKHPKTGVWMPRRQPAGGPKPAEAAKPSAASFVAPDAPPPGAATPVDQFDSAGAAATAATIAVGVTLFGDEWIPRAGEAQNMQGAFAAYFRAKGVADVPPGLALAIAVLGYAGPRFTQPQTLTRLQKFKMWIVNLRARHAANNLRARMPDVSPS